MKSKFSKKFIPVTAWMVLFCFSWTTLGWGVTGAPEVIFSRPEIKIPFELASVQEEYWAAPQAPVVVHIQDAHGHYEAQTKIKQIIQHLKQAGGFSLLLLEGSDTRLDPSIYHFFENPELNRQLADSLMKEGELSGAEMHLIEEMESRGRKMSAYGVENTELYRKDFRLFREIHGGKKDSDLFPNDLREEFDTVAGKFFSPKLLKAVRAWQKFQAGAELLRYALFLLGQAKKILDLDLRDPKNQRQFPQIVRLIRLKDLEPAVNREKAERERENLSRFLKTFKAGEPFALKLEELKAGKGFSRNSERRGLPRYFFEELYDAASPHGFTFEAYPQFKILAQYLVLESEVDSAGLFQEINRLSEDLFFALAQDPREQEMLRFVKDVEFLKRLFSLELTRDDFKKLSADKARLSPPAMMQRLNGFNAETAAVKNVSPETSAAFDKAAQFYGLAEKREQAFLDAIAKRMKEEGQTRAILVTGGFHGPGMAAKFREKGFSFVSVSPRLTVSDEAGGANYLSAMMASKKTLFDRSQISKVMTAVAEKDFTADLAGMTGDPSYPRYAARQILDKASRVSPGLAGARPQAVSFVEQAASLGSEKKTGAPIDSLFVENPFWTDVRDRFLRLLENQYIDADFYAELMKMENIYKAELETPLDDRSLPPIRYKVWRISHNIVQRLSKSKTKRPAKGGIRVVYPGDLAGDEYFMRALQALKKAGASVEEANRFLDNYMEEMTKALATDMSKKIALMNLLPSKSAKDTRLGGGGKGSIILARIEEKNGQFVPASLFNGRRPSRQELARIARATSRAYTEEGLVGIDLDVPAPDRGTDAVFMTWMLDEYFKVLLEHENRGVETPLRKYPGLVQFLNQEPDAIEAATVDNTPYLDRVVLYTRTKHIAVPELGTYTGKPITQGGQYSRAEATGSGALFATELLVSKIHPGNGKAINPLKKVRVAVQGFGNAGQYYADLMARNGARVVALSDISGGVYKRDGLGREELSRLIALTGGGRQLKDYKQADVSVDDTYPTGSFLVDIPPVDILVPAAREHVITEENAAGIKASAVVAVANGPTTMRAERILWEKVVPTIVVSDIFASGGGVAISYVEMKENRKNRYTLSHDSPMRWLRRRMAGTFDEIWQKMDRKKGIDFGYAADIVAISRIQQAISAQSLGQETVSAKPLSEVLDAGNAFDREIPQIRDLLWARDLISTRDRVFALREPGVMTVDLIRGMHIRPDEQRGETEDALNRKWPVSGVIEATALTRQIFGEKDAHRTAANLISELIRNLWMHTDYGVLLAVKTERNGQKGIRLIALDAGRGITNFENAFTPGYTSVGSLFLEGSASYGGLGHGLPYLKEYSDDLNLGSLFGKGTWAVLDYFGTKIDRGEFLSGSSLGQEGDAAFPRIMGAEIIPDVFVLKKEVYDAIFAAYPALRVGKPPTEISPEGYARFLSSLAALQTEPAKRIREALSDPEQGRSLLNYLFAAKTGTRVYMIEQKVWGGDPQRRKAAFISNAYQIAIESLSSAEEKALLEKLTPHLFGIAMQYLIEPYNLAHFLSTAYRRFVSDLAHESVSEDDVAKAKRGLKGINKEWQKQYEFLLEGFWRQYFKPVPSWVGFRLNDETVVLKDEMLSVLNVKYPDFLKEEKPYEVTPEDYHEILGTVEAAHPGLYAQMDKTQEGRLALNAVVREPQVVARRFLTQSSLAGLDENPRNEALLGMAWHAALGRVFEGDLLTDLKRMLGKEIKGARGGAVDPERVFERFAARVTEDDFFMEARAQLTALQPIVERYYAEILANYQAGTAAGQSLGVEGEAPLQPINPALGVRLAETLYVLKVPVLNAVLMIQPDLYTAQTTFHVSEKVYQRFLRALDAQAIPAAERIAQALRASPSGYQDFTDIFESRGRGAVMFLFENSLLGMSPAKRKQLFANAAFAFAANSLEDDDERYLATNFITQILQPMLHNMGETEFQSVDQLYDDILLSLDFVGGALLPPRLMRPVKRGLDHMKANWQALLTVIEQNYDRHYVQPVAPYFGVRLSPEVVVLHHEVFSALSELFPDFGSAWESRSVTPEDYFEFLEKIRDRQTDTARQVYQAIDKTGEGRLKLELLIGPSAGPGHYFIHAEELLDPAERSARLIGAAWEIAFKRLDLPPSVAAELNLILGTVLEPDSLEQPGQPFDFGQSTDTFFRLLAAAGTRADITAALQNEIPSVNAYYDFLETSYTKKMGPFRQADAQSLGGENRFAGIMNGHFESLDEAWQKAGLAPWDIRLAGRNLMYFLGFPERNGEAYPRSELIKKYEASLADGIWIADGPDNQPWETHFEEGFGFFVSRKMWDAFADKRELAKTLVLEAIRPEAARFGLDAKRIAERAAGVPLDSLAGGKGAKPAPPYLSVVNSQIAAVLRGISRDSGVAADAVLDVLDILEKAGPSPELLTLFTSKLNDYYEAVENAMAQDFHKSGLKRLLRGSDDRFHFETVMSRVREFAGKWGVVYNAQKKKALKFLSDAFYVEKALLSQWVEFLNLYVNPDKEEILRQRYVEANLAHDLRVLADEYGQIKVPAEAMRLLREAVEKTVPRDNADLYFKIKIHRILDEEPARIVKDVESKYGHWVRKFFHHNPPRESQMDSNLEATVGVFARRADVLARELRPLAKRIPKFSFVPEPEGASLGEDLSVNVSEGRIAAFFKGVPLLESTPESEREFPHELSRFIYRGPDALTARQALLNHPLFRFDPAPDSQTTRNRLRTNWWPGPLEEHVAVTGNWHDGLAVSAKEGGVLAQYFFRISSENPKTIIFSYRGELLQDKRIRGSGFFVKVLRRILLENPAVENLIVEDAPAGLFEDVPSVPKMPVEMMRAFFDPMVTLFGFLSWDESARPEAEAENFLLGFKIIRGKLNPTEKSAPVQEGSSLGMPQIVLEGQGGLALPPVFTFAIAQAFRPGGELSGLDVAKIIIKLGQTEDPVYDPASKTMTLFYADIEEFYLAGEELPAVIKAAVKMSTFRVVLAKEVRGSGLTAKKEKRLGEALKRLWATPEWQEALEKMPPYQGVDLKNVSTFVVMKSLDPKPTPPQVIPESNALRVYVSDMNKLDLAFTGALRTILNQPPLRIEVAEWSRYLEEIFPDKAERDKIIDRIQKTVSWEAFEPDALSGTRAILLHLEKPVVYRGVTYHSIKIKGATYAGIFQPLKKPHHRGAESTSADEHGVLTHKKDVNFLGGSPASQTGHEAEGMARAFEDGITLDIPLAHGVYPDFEMAGEKGGFMVSLIQGEHDTRMMDTFNDYLHDFAPEEAIDAAHFAQVFQQKGDIYGVRAYVDDFFRRAGRALRDAHDKGYYFNYPHFGNLTEYQGRFYWHDFDSWEDIRQVPAARQIAYRFFDFFQVFNHLGQFRLFKGGAFGQFSGLLGTRPIEAILEGYFYDRLSDHRVGQVHAPEEILRLRRQMDGVPIHQLDHPVIHLLKDVVNKRKISGPNILYSSPSVYVYPKQNSRLGGLLDDMARALAQRVNPLSDVFRNLGVRSISLAENYEDKPVAEYVSSRDEIIVAVPRGMYPGPARDMINTALYDLAVKVRETRVLAFVNRKDPEALRAVLRRVSALGPNAKGGDARVQAIIDQISRAGAYQGTAEVRKLFNPRAAYDAFETAALDHLLESPAALGASLGAEGKAASLYYENRGYGARNSLTAEIVTRDVTGKIIDRFLLEADEAAFDALFAKLFEPERRDPADASVEAFNIDLSPALAYLGIHPGDKGSPLVLEEGAAETPDDEASAKKIVQIAGPGGAVILLWDYSRHEGKKPSLRRFLDQYAGQSGVLVRDFPLETVNAVDLNQALKAYELPALALSTRDEPLILEFKGEKIKFDRKLFDDHGIDPLQALALFKQIIDNPQEKRKELFFKAGLDFDAAAGYWTVSGRFVDSFLKNAYAAEAARRTLARAA